jgi:hypothetical protein
MLFLSCGEVSAQTWHFSMADAIFAANEDSAIAAITKISLINGCVISKLWASLCKDSIFS